MTTNKVAQMATFVLTPWIALAQIAKACSYGSFDTQIGEHSISNHIAGLKEMMLAGDDTNVLDSTIFG